MVEDYNAMMTEIRGAYATMPYRSSSGAFKDYEPLTEEQKTGMSESEIKNYEERAKQGILFGDSTLRNLYERMQSVFQPSPRRTLLPSPWMKISSGRPWRTIRTRWRTSSPVPARMARPPTASCRA